MSTTANKPTTEGYAPLSDPAMVEKFTHNERQKAGKLVRKIYHAHGYGVSIMAQQALKVNELQKELATLGFPPVELFTPDFTDMQLLEEYSKLGAYNN